ncbi:DnaJ subfamily C member 9 like protein [Babesia gibsoni]|uniref:DnaJ subfamily C member 9 like protein n=1 Tax=Babesia gibsoni TaxID=33632 RepID=A0AAD8PDU6_BABGI|nr:DnaJ subfamily C member 9 like protein [Babesia gibsoni]
MGKTRTRLYEILGVQPDASTRDIVKAYRIAALKTHPDKLARLPAEEREKANASFAQLNHAYEILKDETRRKKYDQFGWEGEESDAFASAFEFYKGPISTEDIEDFSKTYKKSKAEEDDLVDFYNRNDGDISNILLYVPLSEAEDLKRFVNFFKDKIKKDELKSTKGFEKTSTDDKLKEIKKKYEKKMKKASKSDDTSGSFDDLAAQILANRKKREGDFSSLISRMEQKYKTKVAPITGSLKYSTEAK